MIFPREFTHRQGMEAVRGALEMRLTGGSQGGGLAPSHPLRVAIRARHDELKRAFVEAHIQ